MKVLIIGSSKFPIPAVHGGAVPALIEELIQQQEKGKKIELFCCSLWDQKAEKKAEQYKNTTFIWAKVPKWIHYIDRSITYFMKTILKKERLLSIGFIFQILWFSLFVGYLIHKENYDRIIFENSIPMLFSMKMFLNRRKYKNKYYIHMHSVPRRYYGNKKIFSNCKYLISISNYVAKEIYSNPQVSIKENQIKLMYNCINTDIFTPQLPKTKNEYLKKYGIDHNKKIILFAGRLCKEKGIEEVIEAFKTLNNENYLLVIVGANFYDSGIVSPYEKQLKELVEPVKGRIFFTGYVDYMNMPYIYNMGDVIVLPSMWEEPAGMTIIEAMACCKPVITTISGGIPEYTGQGNCILLKRDTDIISNLAINIKNLIENPDFASNLAEKGYLRAIKYNTSYYYKQFLEIITEE